MNSVNSSLQFTKKGYFFFFGYFCFISVCVYTFTLIICAEPFDNKFQDMTLHS